MHNTTTIYQSITGWKKVKNGTYVDENGRNVVRVIVGEVRGEDEKVSYIVEPFWEDILHSIINNANAFSIQVSPGGYPQVFARRDHRLVMHNQAMMKLIPACKDTLQDVDTDYLCGALAEIRKSKRGKKEDEKNICMLEQQVSDAIGRPVLHDFIAYVNSDFFNDAYSDADPTAAAMSGLSYDELKDCAMDAIFYEMTDEFPQGREEVLEDLEVSKENLQDAVKDELLRRLITGRISGN